MKGKVYIVGAGSGKLGFLTVEAQNIIRNAKCVIYDRLISDEIIGLIPDDAQKFYAGKKPDHHYLTQDEINALLVEKASNGEDVVRLKGGDPYIFGRGGEEVEYLIENKIDYQITTGINAAHGASIALQIPLTYRGVSEGLVQLTGHSKDNKITDINYDALAKLNYTICLYMSVGNIAEISQNLINAGLSDKTPVAVIMYATYEGKEKSTFSDLKNISDKIIEEKIKNPAIIIIGEVIKHSPIYKAQLKQI